MALRAYGDAAQPDAERHAAMIARRILKDHPKVLNARVIRRDWRLPGLKDAKHVHLALETLEEAGWCRRSPTRGGNTPGRAREDYQVNPMVYGGS